MESKENLSNKIKENLNTLSTVAFLSDYLMDSIMFTSIQMILYFGLVGADERYFWMGLWALIPIFVLKISAPFFKGVKTYLILCIAFCLGGFFIADNDTIGVLNLITMAIISAYFLKIKNAMNLRKIADYAMTNSDQIKDHRGSIGMNFMISGIIIVGFLLGVLRSKPILMNYQAAMCLFLVAVLTISNNVHKLEDLLRIHSDNSSFPLREIRRINGLIIASITLLIVLAAALFYAGDYSQVNGGFAIGFVILFKNIMRIILFLWGHTGKESSYTEPVKETEAETKTFKNRLEGQNVENPFPEALAEAFGALLAAIVIVTIIYIFVTYLKNYKSAKQVKLDYVEYIRPNETKERDKKSQKTVKQKESREVRSVRKIYKKMVLDSKKKIDSRLSPSQITKAYITDLDSSSRKITQIYEKARYSENAISDEEIDFLKNKH